jgi:hypothetical protein
MQGTRRTRARGGAQRPRPLPRQLREPARVAAGELPPPGGAPLTTLGFGDLSPDVGLPQALTVFEALTGHVFLVTMVARLVTLWGRQGALGDERQT